MGIDPEKEFAIGDDDAGTTTSSGRSSPVPAPASARISKTHSRTKQARPWPRRSSSTSSDPFSALETALTPDLETPAEHAARESLSRIRTGTSIGSVASRPPDFEVVFDDADPENPRNWPLWYRSWVTFSVSLSTWVVVLNSTSYTASIPGLVVEYNTSAAVATLGVTTYLLGLAVGSLVVAPMSELYGRQPVYLICMVCASLLIIPCGLATSLSEILVVRFFG